MESDGLVGRIARGDFFSVLPGGFFVLLMAALAMYPPAQTTDFIAAIRPLADGIRENPYYLVLVIFGAFLIGSVIRSLPLVWAERVSPPFHSRFPFHAQLKGALKDLTDNCQAAMFRPEASPDLSKDINRNIWNYWKDTLCCHNEKAFHFYQSFEIRARYAAGLVWAGIGGMIASMTMFMRCPHAALQTIVVSALIYLAFSYNLRRARDAEARALLFLFIAHQQSGPSAPGSA